MTVMSSDALRAFEQALIRFEESLIAHCRKMEGGIEGCRKFMKDENSIKALNNAMNICAEIRTCINPTENVLQRVRTLIQNMSSEPIM